MYEHAVRGGYCFPDARTAFKVNSPKIIKPERGDGELCTLLSLSTLRLLDRIFFVTYSRVKIVVRGSVIDTTDENYTVFLDTRESC